MKKSFVFYKSFYDAINVLGEKSQLKLYKSIMRLNFNDYETVEDMERLCDEIETDLKQNRYVYGTFMSIKPQLLANYKRYSNGIKGAKYGSLGAEFGKLGGRPKNPPNENVNVNENENVNVNVNENENENSFEREKKEKKKDIFLSPIKKFFQDEYQKLFNNLPFLSQSDLVRLEELSQENENFEEIIPAALEKLKRIKFDPKLNFTPSASWLLKGNNFERVMNGEFEPQKTEMELLKEKLGIVD